MIVRALGNLFTNTVHQTSTFFLSLFNSLRRIHMRFTHLKILKPYKHLKTSERVHVNVPISCTKHNKVLYQELVKVKKGAR